jgi:hypothetical protein
VQHLSPDETDVQRRQRPHDPVTGDRVQPATARVLDLQRRFGNAAVGQVLGARQPAVAPRPVQRLGVGSCGGACGGGGRCACQASHRESQDETAAVQRVDYSTTHTCGVKESARIFSSWAVAVAKLVENLPALDFAYATGLHTPLLKRKLLKHFAAGTAAERKAVLKKIVPRYHMILLKMGPGIAKVRCGGTHCEHNDYAYTNSGSSNSTMWLCNVEFTNKPILDLAATWIHELSHSLYDTDDNGYYTYTNATTQTLAGSLNEADCYGNFMVDYT